MIETPTDVFDTSEATLMDFRVGQQHGTTFVYVMPFEPNRALIEYTLFSSTLLKPEEYDEGLKEYISNYLGVSSYSVAEVEAGVIPMTNYKFPRNNGNIINIGTAGGQTKASSGYTFNFIQKHSAAIVKSLARGKSPVVNAASRRFDFYDSTLLHILHHNKVPGDHIFSRFFKKNKPQRVLRFLDNESSLSEELLLISSLPTMPFLKAALKQL